MILTDPAAERGVLAGLCMYGSDAYFDVADLVSAQTFSIGSNQVIFACLRHLLHDKKVDKADYPSILSAANALGVGSTFNDSEETKHLRAVMNLVIEQGSIRTLAAKIRKLEITRELKGEIRAVDKRLEQVTGDETLEQIVNYAEAPLFAFTSRLSGAHSSGPSLMGEGASAYFQYLLDNPRESMGIPTPFVRYNAAIGGGLRANSVDLIGARQKVGKSHIVDNVAVHVAGVLGVPVLNIDTEMSKEEHLIRVGACLANLPSDSIEKGRLTADERQRLMVAAAKLETFPYHYDCVIGLEFEDILARMRRWVLRTVGLADNGRAKPCVIIYDYLKLLDGSQIKSNLAEHQLLRFISSGLKNFMGRYGASCLTFVQLNRDGLDYEDSRVVRGSDGILDAVTSFSIFKWKTDEERAESPGEGAKYTHKLIPLICRHGPGLRDGDYINMRADYAKATITEGPTKSAGQTKGFAINDNKGQIEFGQNT